MNTTSGPAFPVPSRWDSQGNWAAHSHEDNGMTLRQYAAIKLRVPNSGTDWLDDMIRTSIRNDFATKAMQSHIAVGFVSLCQVGHPEDQINSAIAKVSYEMADAMMVAGGSA